MTNPFVWFLENFGKQPEPRPPIIPGPWRIPFFVALSVVSFAVLAALVYYVVIPGIESMQSAVPTSTVAPVK
jgi:hypothetical protein